MRTAQVILWDLGSWALAVAYAEKIARRAARNGEQAMADEYRAAADWLKAHKPND